MCRVILLLTLILPGGAAVCAEATDYGQTGSRSSTGDVEIRANTENRHRFDEYAYREDRQADGTHVLGTIHAAVAWKAEQGPYLMEENVFVARDGVLSIGPGVEVMVGRLTESTASIDAYVGLSIQGTLRAEGRPESMIRFTSVADTPNPYREWQGIVVTRDSSASILKWVLVEDAIFGIDAYGSALVAHCVFRGCHSGIYLEPDFAGDVIHNVCAYNARAGIRCKGTPGEATITDNICYESGYGIEGWLDAVAYADYNLHWSSRPNYPALAYSGMAPGPHDVVADPRFVNPREGDFGLAGDSPARGAGTANADMGLDAGTWSERVGALESEAWLSEIVSKRLSAGQPDGAAEMMAGFEEYPLAPERFAAYLDVAKTAHRQQRPELAADLLYQSTRADPFSKEAPESLFLLAQILEKDLNRRDEAGGVLTQLATNYFPYNPHVLQATERTADQTGPSQRILLDTTLQESSIFDRGLQGSSNFGQYEVIRTLAEAGYVVHTNDYQVGARADQRGLTPSLVRRYGLIILNGKYGGRIESIPQEVLTTLVDYVEAGGSLLVVASGRQLGSGKVSQFYNPLVELLGLHFEEDVDLPGRVGTVTDHAAVRHLSSFVHVFGVPVRVARGEVLGLVEGQPVIALTRCGKGRVVGAGLGSGLMGNTLCVGQSKDEEASLRNRQLLLALAAHLLSGR